MWTPDIVRHVLSLGGTPPLVKVVGHVYDKFTHVNCTFAHPTDNYNVEDVWVPLSMLAGSAYRTHAHVSPLFRTTG